ncbi:MAG: MFS transporter [Pseudomonadota bacterium]
MSAMVLSIMDRQVLTLLVEPIKCDLELSDTQFSLLLGPAFVVFYLLFGLPFGWATDHFRRGWIIAFGITVWSLATMSCGLAGSFVALIAARALVGAGEASLMPASMSMLSDTFSRERMPFVTGVLSVAMHIGGAGAMLLGALVLAMVGAQGLSLGALGSFAGWQMTFFLVGAPGLILALAFLFSREPRRGGFASVETAPRSDLNMESKSGDEGILRNLIPFLLRNRVSVGVHLTSAALLTIGTYAFVSWSPAYLMRVQEFSSDQAARALGLIMISCGPVGTLAGGWITSRLQADTGREDAAWLVMAGSGMGSALFGAIAFSSDSNPVLMAAALAMAILFGSGYLGVIHAGLQAITPPELRGRMAALMLLAMTGVGASLGPVLVALLTDHAFGNALRVGDSIAIVSVSSGVLAGVLLLFNRASFSASYRDVDAAGCPSIPNPTSLNQTSLNPTLRSSDKDAEGRSRYE